MPRGRARHQTWASDQLRVLQKLYEECYRFVIQKVPPSYNRPRGLKDTTCRHSDCPNKVTPPGSYRASLEKLGDCDPASNVIGYEAIDSRKNVRKTEKGSQGRRGLGASGQEWWCLKCLEALFFDLRQHVWKHKPDGSTLHVHPLTSIQYWIIPERRTIPQYGGIYYTLRAPQMHLLAKWQGVKTFDELCDRPAEGHFDLPEDPAEGPFTLYLGHDEESFYLNTVTRDMRGVLAENKVCEINACDVRGCSLSEAFRRLDKKEDRMVEEKWMPIMAERKRKAEEEGQCAEEQLTGRSGELAEEAVSEKPEKPTDSVHALFEGYRRAVPVVYVGNDLPANSGKRKRCDLDQSQEPARPNTFVPQASGSVLAHITRRTNKAAQACSASPDLTRSPFDSAHSSGTQGGCQAVSRPNSIARTTQDAALSSSPAFDRQVPAPTSARFLEVANGREDPLSLVSQAGLGPYATAAVQPSPPPKFAPNPASRLCHRKPRVNSGAPTVEQEK